MDFNSGDTLVFYTDGIPEAENSSGEFYGIDRLCTQLEESRDLPVKSLHDKLIHDLHQHIDGHTIYDDITLVIVRCN
jgi:serine phosphatase RsbU (regulator of sigma subunit)